jgi:ABC-type branched-subunit amino acid transport system substrate-binding protein
MASLRVGACLSLSGRFARFGRQAARGLEAWRSLDGEAELVIEDDRSDRQALQASLGHVAARSDILLGPYSTYLAKAAGRMAAESGWLLWNHGGSGDDVEAAHPGHVVSVPTPASRYAEPFLQLLAGGSRASAELVIVSGRGSFGRQVSGGAGETAHWLGIRSVRIGPDSVLASAAPSREWALLCAGSFEEDVDRVAEARSMRNPPRTVCAVAAGVREFGRTTPDASGVFGIAQWFPGSGHGAALGPPEADFLSAYQRAAGGLPDYPAVQAVAAAAVAAHCARLAGGTDREALWQAACALATTTLFGGFRIDPSTGSQTGHQTVLVRWAAAQDLRPAGRSA